LSPHRARVVIFGYGELAVAGLASLDALRVDIAAVVVPGNRSGRDVERVGAEARRLGVPVWTQFGSQSEPGLAQQLRHVEPDVLFTWSYSMVLTPAILAVPRHGAVNIHGGLLPQYRGGHVMQWAILNGEKESGATLHYMDSGVDTGPIIDTVRFPITPGDDAMRVREKLKAAGLGLIERWWPRIADGTAPSVPQDEQNARYWPLRAPRDGLIDWAAPADRVCRLVRALACNTPGAFTHAGGRLVSIRGAIPLPRGVMGAAIGAITGMDANGLRVSAGGADVLVTEAEVDGVRISGGGLTDLRRVAHDRFSSASDRVSASNHV